MDIPAQSPEICTLTFHVLYQGREVAGTAQGAAFPDNKTFSISILGNSFDITAVMKDQVWQWRSNAPDNPLDVLASEAGLAIEHYFGHKESPGL